MTALAALRGVSKRFGSLQAVDTFSLEVRAGEVQALIGGNGAGKTTAMKLLAGLRAEPRAAAGSLPGATTPTAKTGAEP